MSLLQQAIIAFGRLAGFVPANFLVGLVNRSGKHRLRAFLAADTYLQQHCFVSLSRRVLELDRRLFVL